MTTTLTKPSTDRRIAAETCPTCGGVLTVNQDGWKICYSCGYSSPGVAPEPVDGGIVASQPEQGESCA